jgi:hypothetical protein
LAEKAGRLGAPKEHIPCGSVTEKQQRLPAFSAKTLRAVDLLAWACVGSSVIAHCGDIPASPPRERGKPWPKPKSLAAGPLAIFGQALTDTDLLPPPQILATELADELETAFDLFTKIANKLPKLPV